MNHLGLFAKFWQPGKVKTRLAVTIGDQAANVIYQHFLSQLLIELTDCGDRRTVVFSPSSEESSFRRQIPSAWELTPQSAGNLGDRMSHFFQHSRTESHSRCGNNTENSSTACKTVVIGADTPELTNDDLDEAFELLDRYPAVLGPSRDGGYYLIGMNQQAMQPSFESIFDNVEWSSGNELQQTIANFEKQSIGVGLLAARNDVDDYEDLLKLKDLLATTLMDPASTSSPKRGGVTSELIENILNHETGGVAGGVPLRGPLE